MSAMLLVVPTCSIAISLPCTWSHTKWYHVLMCLSFQCFAGSLLSCMYPWLSVCNNGLKPFCHRPECAGMRTARRVDQIARPSINSDTIRSTGAPGSFAGAPPSHRYLETHHDHQWRPAKPCTWRVLLRHCK